MKRYLLCSLILLTLTFSSTNAQNTFGTTFIDSNVTEGFTLFTINKSTYLINNCGQVINSWVSTFNPGNAVYLLGDGSILRAGRTNSSDINFGGRGGVIEKFDWDGNQTWQYFYDTPMKRQHHDVFPMPNGNVLILAVTVMTQAEAIQAGRDPSILASDGLYNEQIIEVTPVGADQANVVWEWNINDHFIQDFDNTKDNFGVVADNPNLLNINYRTNPVISANWLHFNSIQYDATLDQIVISSRNMSEMYIIDHSTTTVEAATGSGGTYGKGGDLLYRWGNPAAYDRGTTADRQLFGQHFPHYVRNSTLDNGKIIVFNNGNGRTPSFSEVYILSPPTSSAGFYSDPGVLAYGPLLPEDIYTDPTPTDFYSPIISGAQRLSNGNTLIVEGTSGRIFEKNPSDTILWEYIVPIDNTTGDAATQGDDATGFSNNTFRATKYSTSYSAFNGRDVTPGAPLENNPDLASCLMILSTDENDVISLSIYPNPTVDFVTIDATDMLYKIEVFNMTGNKITEYQNTSKLDLRTLHKGVYFLRISSKNQIISKKIIKI